MKTLPSDPRLVLNDEHIYFYDGVQVPNPTMLFSEEALCNLSGIPEDVLIWKTGLGKAVHFACHLFDIGQLGDIDPAIEPYLNAYKKFRIQYGFNPTYSEQVIYSRNWRFATTIDRQGYLVCGKRAGESIIELKTTLGMYPTTGPQTASHKIAFEENVSGLKIKYRYGLQLMRDGEFKLHPYDDPQDETTFFSALHLHHWKVKHKIFKPQRMEK